MNHFATIFRKEFTDTIRDRRTLFVMVIFPLLLMPLLLTVVTKIQTSSMKKAGEKIIRVGLVTERATRLDSRAIWRRPGVSG